MSSRSSSSNSSEYEVTMPTMNAFSLLQSNINDNKRILIQSNPERFNYIVQTRKHLSLDWIEMMDPSASSLNTTTTSISNNNNNNELNASSNQKTKLKAKQQQSNNNNNNTRRGHGLKARNRGGGGGNNANANLNKNENLEKKENLDSVDKETQIMQALQESIEECSDQRLRALLMLFRKCSNMENRITLKDLNNAFQELSIKIPNRVLSDLVEQFTDQYGIDFEKMYKLLLKIQTSSTRDGAKVKKLQLQATKENDASILQRIAKSFQKNSDVFYTHFEEFKIKLYDRCEKHHSSMLSNKEIQRLLETHQIPLYGALLNAAFERTNYNNLVNASKFVNFLEEAARLNIESNLNKQTSDMKPEERVVEVAAADDAQSMDTASLQYENQIGADLEERITKARNSVVSFNDNAEYVHVNNTNRIEPAVNVTKITTTATTVKVKLGQSDEMSIPANLNLPSVGATDIPSFKFEIDWIYGYSGSDTRQNLVSVAFTNEIAYSAGSVIVLYNLEKKRQRYFREHTTLVKCMCLYLNGFYLLSASVKTKSTKQTLKLWRVDNLKTIKNLASSHIQGSIVAMSPSKYAAEKIVAIDHIDTHRYQIVLLDINKDTKIASLELNCVHVLDIGLNPKEENYIVTIGKEHLGFWKLEPNKIVELAQANYERNLKALFITSFCFKDNGDLITGDSNGNIYIWPFEEYRISQCVKHGHEGSILSMTIFGSVMITTGRDNKIYGWSLPKLDHAGALQLPKQECGVKNLIFHKEYIITATKFNSLYYAKKTSNDANFPLNGVVFQPDTIVEGHSSEITQLNIHRLGAHELELVSCGLDGLLCSINPLEHLVKYKKSLKGVEITSIESSKVTPTSVFLGTLDGVLIMANLNTEQKSYTEVTKLKISNQKLDYLQLSPDEKQLIASNLKSGVMYMINILLLSKEQTTAATVKLILNGSFREHKTELSGIDWSSERINGTYLIRSSSYIEKKLLIWRANDFLIIDDYMQLDENLKWNTQNCLFTHESIGTLSLLYTEKNPNEFTFIKETSENYILIMDNKNLNLYIYQNPVNDSTKVKYRKYTDLASPTAAVAVATAQQQQQKSSKTSEILTNSIKFDENLSYLFIADSINSVIIQWKLTKS